MWKWLLNLFKVEDEEVQENEYLLQHRIGKRIYNIPNMETMYGKIIFVKNKKTGKLEPTIKYFKKARPKKSKYGIEKKK